MDSTADESHRVRRESLIQLREDAGLSQDALAEALQLSRSSIARHERGEGGEPYPDVCRRYADFYKISVREVLALFAKPDGSAGGKPELPPSRAMAAGRLRPSALPFTGLAVGRAHLETVDEAIADIVAHYEQTGPSVMSARALRLRTQVMDWMDASPRVRDRPEIYRRSAQLGGLLSYMAVNIGRFRLADAYAAEALHLADEAGDLELQQWLRGTQAHGAYYEGKWDLAIAYARAGIELAPEGPQSIRLLVNGEARSQAKLGRRGPAERAVGRAMDLLDHQRSDPGLTPCIAFEPYGYARLAANAATANVAAGDINRVLAFTRDLDRDVESLDSVWSRALINLDVAATLLAADRPEVGEAMRLGRAAMEICETRPIRSVWQRAYDLREIAGRWSNEPAVADYREAFRDWTYSDETLAVAGSAAVDSQLI